MRRLGIGPLVVLLSGCALLAPGASPTPSQSLPPSSVSARPSVSLPPATPTLVPTPGPDAIPTFTAGTKVATNVSGLRLRSRPGTSQSVIAALPAGSKLIVELGPLRVDSYGWYLVHDADSNPPKFTEGWVAAGFAPDPFLVPATFNLLFNPILAGYAHQGDGDFGPVRITDANVAVRWAASPPTAGSCSFAVDLKPGSGTAVPAIRATVGSVPVPGDLYSQFFAAHPELTGDIFVHVASQCSWALTFISTATVPG
ncbi:MAG: SH3 domain-containing protein [Chloroflexota bacterium]|nr:SH3 domain-containing protein [Chloroflexota bacterium]